MTQMGRRIGALVRLESFLEMMHSFMSVHRASSYFSAALPHRMATTLKLVAAVVIGCFVPNLPPILQRPAKLLSKALVAYEVSRSPEGESSPEPPVSCVGVCAVRSKVILGADDVAELESLIFSALVGCTFCSFLIFAVGFGVGRWTGGGAVPGRAVDGAPRLGRVARALADQGLNVRVRQP